MTWRENDQAILRANFAPTATNVLTDPTTVTVKIKTPSGVTTTYTYAGSTVTRDGTGRYSRTISLTEAGKWEWQVEATGTVVKTEAGSIKVQRSEL